jgi:hypothetical protein
MGDVLSWHIVGDWFDNCSCAVPCPCTFAQAPDNGDGRGASAGKCDHESGEIRTAFGSPQILLAIAFGWEGGAAALYPRKRRRRAPLPRFNLPATGSELPSNSRRPKGARAALGHPPLTQGDRLLLPPPFSGREAAAAAL